MIAYQDPNNKGNSPKHHTGKKCVGDMGVVKKCDKPAGTAWSPYWCFECNVIRMDKIDTFFKNAIK